MLLLSISTPHLALSLSFNSPSVISTPVITTPGFPRGRKKYAPVEQRKDINVLRQLRRYASITRLGRGHLTISSYLHGYNARSAVISEVYIAAGRQPEARELRRRKTDATKTQPRNYPQPGKRIIHRMTEHPEILQKKP